MPSFRVLLQAVLTLLVCLCVVEYRLRYREGQIFGLENIFERKFRLASNTCGTVPDRFLGWAPAPSKSRLENKWKTEVTLDAEGFRSFPGQRKTQTGAVLAVGDSFTFGDQVSDAETWPAHLEKRMGRRVSNAGVCGYGLDQSFLRAQKLVPQLKPEILVFGFLSLGLVYNTWASHPGPYFTPKPYFIVDKNKLLLTQSPVPASTPTITIDAVHAFFGHSYLAERLLGKLRAEWWNAPFARFPTVPTDQDGAEVGCRLMGSLQNLSKTGKARAIVLLQYGPAPDAETLTEMTAVRRCALQQGLEVLDLHPFLQSVAERNRLEFESYWKGGHMSDKGNAFVAGLLADKIASEPSLSL